MKREDLKSPRLLRVYDYLTLNLSATTKEIEDKCQVAAARDYIRRLRDRGLSIQTIEEGFSENGSRVVRYRLSLEPPKPVHLTLL
jgi:hypothetical protein